MFDESNHIKAQLPVLMHLFIDVFSFIYRKCAAARVNDIIRLDTVVEEKTSPTSR